MRDLLPLATSSARQWRPDDFAEQNRVADSTGLTKYGYHRACLKLQVRFHGRGFKTGSPRLSCWQIVIDWPQVAVFNSVFDVTMADLAKFAGVEMSRPEGFPFLVLFQLASLVLSSRSNLSFPLCFLVGLDFFAASLLRVTLPLWSRWFGIPR